MSGPRFARLVIALDLTVWLAAYVAFSLGMGFDAPILARVTLSNVVVAAFNLIGCVWTAASA